MPRRCFPDEAPTFVQEQDCLQLTPPKELLSSLLKLPSMPNQCQPAMATSRRAFVHSVPPAGKSISLGMMQALLGKTTVCPGQTGRYGWTGNGGLEEIPPLSQRWTTLGESQGW